MKRKNPTNPNLGHPRIWLLGDAIHAMLPTRFVLEAPGKWLVVTDGFTGEWEATRRCLTAPICCLSCGV